VGVLLAHQSSLLADKANLWSGFSWAYLGAGLFLALLHFFYLGYFIRINNYLDTEIAKDYEKRILDAIDGRAPCRPKHPMIWIAKVLKWIQEKMCRRTSSPAPWTWGIWFQAGVTLFLAVVGPVALHAW
jgi:hypothetical protein